MKRAFCLIGFLITVALGCIFLCGICYVSKKIIKRGRVIAAQREQALRTNGLAQCAIPTQEEWITDLPAGSEWSSHDGIEFTAEIPDQWILDSIRSIGVYRYSASTTLRGPWIECGELTADSNGMHSAMVDLLMVIHQTRPDLPAMFIQWFKE